jgi:type I restriction enzyme, S subunit
MMSRKTKTTATKEEATPAMVPKLRFPEFRKLKGWSPTALNVIADPVTERATQGDEGNVLSLSAEHGIVLQSEFFGKKVAGDNSERYLKIARNDFVYNDRTTKASTYGTIKRLSKHSGGIVSPIYKCFRFYADENPVFWEQYFESGNHDVALRGLVNEGARAGRFNISISQFLSTVACRPDKAEQQKIAACLSSVDDLITAQARKVDALKTHKKGLMQQLFPREGETQPRLRFPEFQNAGEWEKKPLGGLCRIRTGKKDANEGAADGAYPFFTCAEQHIYSHNYSFDAEAILIAGNANVGQTSYYNGKFEAYQRTYVLTEFKGIFVPYLYSILNANLRPDLLAQVQTSAMSYIRLPMLEEYQINAPPTKDEQQRIATCLSSLDALITAATQKHEALKTHKKGLMQQLFPSPEDTTNP